MRIIHVFTAATILLSAPASADSCGTNVEGCSGTWHETNIFSQPRCYVIFWASGNGFKNFCLQPGESATEEVRSGDSYCVAANATPNPYTCTRQPFLAE